jgi:hypothetical protein
MQRYLGSPDAADRSVLRRCAGAVLDIGSGPGRLVRALSASGRPALGIDISLCVVGHSLRAGAPAVRASVFEALPTRACGGAALLIDGNIDVAALLRRVRQLVETTGSQPSMRPWSPWAVIGMLALREVAPAAGWRPAEE